MTFILPPQILVCRWFYYTMKDRFENKVVFKKAFPIVEKACMNIVLTSKNIPVIFRPT